MPSEIEAIINHNFKYHQPRNTQPERYELIRNTAKEFALIIVRNSRNSREQAQALVNLEQTVMWANAGIARNE